MKDLEKLDDFFSSSLENFEVAPPVDAKKAIYNELKKLNTKSNKKGGWLLLAITSVSVVATAMYVNQSGSKKQQTEVTAIQIPKVETEINFNKANNINLTTETEKNKPVQLVNTNSNNTISNSEIRDNKSGTKSEIKDSFSNENYTNPKIKTGALGSESIALSAITIHNSIEEKQTKPIEETKAYNAIGESNMDLNSDPILSNETSSAGEQVSKQAITQIPVSEEQNTTNALLDSAAAESPVIPFKEKPEVPQIKSNSYYVLAHVGTGINSNHFYKSNEIATRELKDSIAFNKPYINLQLLAGIQKGFFGISTGINLMKQTEKLRYNYIEQKTERILVDSIYINPVTHDTIITHNVPVDTLMSYYKTNNLQTVFITIQIPLFFTYRFPIQSKWLIDISAGGSVNFLISSKGNYKISPEGSLSEYNKKASAPLKNVSFNAQAMFGLNYILNRNSSLIFSIPFQFGLSNIYKKEYFIDRSINTTGIQIGYKYDF